MTGKLLQILGLFSIVILVGGAIAGFGVLKDRVRVVVMDDQADTGADATALLRDEVQQLAMQLQALQLAIASNFEQLASGLDGAAEARHEDVRELRREVAKWTGDLQQVRVALGSIDGQLTAVRSAAVVAPVGTPEAAPDATVAVALEAEAAAEAAVEQQTNTPPPAIEAAPPSKPKTTGFLSFQLPATGFAFDEPQEYTLLPQLCRVGFDAKSTLHDFTGVTANVSGTFRADWDDPAGLCEGKVVVEANTLKSGVDGRDRNMQEHLDTAQHPDITFAIRSFGATAVDVVKKTAAGQVTGRMTIRGKTRELSMPVAIEVDPQQRVVIKGQAKLLLSDYDVPVPSQLGVINMQDEVVVWVALRARAQAVQK